MEPHEQAHQEDVVQATCASCGAVNRFPRRRATEDPNCGRCHQLLFPRKPVAVTDATWQREVEDSPIPVLVDFWAPWCGPCRALEPVIEQIAAERGGKLKVVKLHTDENPRVSARFDIRSIPTMMVFRGPLVIDQITGAQPKAAIDARLDRVV